MLETVSVSLSCIACCWLDGWMVHHDSENSTIKGSNPNLDLLEKPRTKIKNNPQKASNTKAKN